MKNFLPKKKTSYFPQFYRLQNSLVLFFRCSPAKARSVENVDTHALLARASHAPVPLRSHSLQTSRSKTACIGTTNAKKPIVLQSSDFRTKPVDSVFHALWLYTQALFWISREFFPHLSEIRQLFLTGWTIKHLVFASFIYVSCYFCMQIIFYSVVSKKSKRTASTIYFEFVY